MIKLFIGAVFLSNVLFTKYLGIRLDKKNTLHITLLTAIIAIISSMSNYFMSNMLDKLGILYVRNIIFIITIVIVSSIVLTIYKMKTKNKLDLLPTIVTNSIILGLSLIVSNSGFNTINALVYTLGAVIGYVLIMLLMYYLELELNKRKVYEPLKEYPIMLITLGIICMILERL